MPIATENPILTPEMLPRLGRHLAHELNNPISAIASSAFLIQDFIDTATGGQLETEMIQPFIEGIREECDKLKTIVEEFAKLTTTESILAMPIDLEEFVRNRTNEFVNEGLPVTATDLASFTVQADPSQLQTVLKSLVQYAAQSGADRVELSALTTEESCELRVRADAPRNLSADDLADLFNPLPARRLSGFGLKLPLAQKIIALHRGSVNVTSNEEGTTFCVTLPRTQESAFGQV
jgi:signal transduction histidine kinase